MFIESESVSVAIAVEKLVENLTLDQYMEEYIASVREYDPNLQIIEQSRTTTLTGTPGYKLVNNGTIDVAALLQGTGLDVQLGNMINFDPIPRTTMSFFTMHDNNVFGIVYTDSNGGVLRQACNVIGDLMPECASLADIDDPYSHYLPIAQKMVDSFKIITTQNQTNDTQPIPLNNGTQATNNNPCSIIGTRLATGEIPIEEYERLREVLQC